MDSLNTIVIFGGGPSISSLHLPALSPFHVFVVNYTLRFVSSLPFECHFFGSFDSNVVSTLSPLLKQYLLGQHADFLRYFYPNGVSVSMTHLIR